MKPDPLMTIFSAPKPFTNPQIAILQRNAIASWLALGDQVEVVLLGNEAGLAEMAAEFSIRHIPDVAVNTWGTPLISAMFSMSRQVNNSPLMTCVNTDIILLPNFLVSAQKALNELEKFLLVGRRYDLAVKDLIDYSPGWQAYLEERISKEGRLHPPGGSDYFIFPRQCFDHIPDFAIGRAGWDNWMIYEARQQGWKVVDATGTIYIVHQDHDYSHLPGGVAHYRLPETEDNVRLAGGKRCIFELGDADFYMEGGDFFPARLTWQKFWREVEVFPLVKMHFYPLAQLFYAVFHPNRAYKELRAWLRTRQKK